VFAGLYPLRRKVGRPDYELRLCRSLRWGRQLRNRNDVLPAVSETVVVKPYHSLTRKKTPESNPKVFGWRTILSISSCFEEFCRCYRASILLN
jgi:hypothetical protein